jgi:hypothetical protein
MATAAAPLSMAAAARVFMKLTTSHRICVDFIVFYAHSTKIMDAISTTKETANT